MRSKKAFYNIITNFLLQLVIIVYGFIVPKIIISSFGSNVNGLISSITQFLAYITLLESGFGPVVKSALYKPIASKDNKTIGNILKTSERFFKKIAYIFCIYIIILSIIYPSLVNSEYNNFYTISLIVIISISTFAEYFFGMTYKLFLQADQKTYVISVIQIASYVLSIIAIIIMTRILPNIHIIKLVSGFIFVLRPIMQNIYVKRKYNVDFNNSENYNLKNKWDGLAQHIASVVHNNTDIVVLSIFSSLTDVSIYSVYNIITKGLKSVVQALNSGIDATFGDMLAKNEYENMNKSFKTYEAFYFTVITIIFSCAAILIVPFVKVYTKDITDANYIKPLFAYLIVLAEFANMIRLPYISLTYSSGHFKETRLGAWIESILNLVLSLVLVFKFGLVGVAIGTLISTVIRSIEFNYHASKYILKRGVKSGFVKPLIAVIEMLIIVFVLNKLYLFPINNYINWFIYSIIILVMSTIITFFLNCIIYRSDFKNIFKIFKRTLNKKGVASYE